MRWLYLIFGEVGAIGSIALSILLLIQGIGSIVSIFFFAIVPLVIALTLFVAFLQTQIDVHRKRKYHSCGMLIHGEVPA